MQQLEEDHFQERMKKFTTKTMTKDEIMDFVEESVKWIEKQTEWAQKPVKDRLKMIDKYISSYLIIFV